MVEPSLPTHRIADLQCGTTYWLLAHNGFALLAPETKAALDALYEPLERLSWVLQDLQYLLLLSVLS